MPNFNIIPTIKNSVNNIERTNLNTIYNKVLGTSFVGEMNILDILNEVESRRKSCSYGYSEQKTIGEKPRLTYTGEGLKRYSLSITLHHSFCRPDYIIEQLENLSATGEAFSYFQGQKYIGEYVVTNIEITTVDEYKDTTLCAEVSIELTETNEENKKEDFEQQTKQIVSIPNSLIKNIVQNSSKTPIDIIKETTETIFEELTEKVINEALRNAESYIDSTLGGVSGNIF